MIVDTPDGIKFFQMGARKGALELELHGLKRRGQSAYSICKQVYGLSGNRESVVAQMSAMVEGAITRKRGGPAADVIEQSKTFPAGRVRDAFWYGHRGEWINRP